MLIAHKSGHMGVMNTKAMEQMHLDKNTPDPGAEIRRDENGNLTGYAEESAFIKAGNQITHPDIHKIAKQFEKATKKLCVLRNYNRTRRFCKGRRMEPAAQHGRTKRPDIRYCRYVDLEHHADLIKQNPQYRSYHNRLKLGGYKLFLDGFSPRKNRMDEQAICKQQRLLRLCSIH